MRYLVSFLVCHKFLVGSLPPPSSSKMVIFILFIINNQTERQRPTLNQFHVIEVYILIPDTFLISWKCIFLILKVVHKNENKKKWQSSRNFPWKTNFSACRWCNLLRMKPLMIFDSIKVWIHDVSIYRQNCRTWSSTSKRCIFSNKNRRIDHFWLSPWPSFPLLNLCLHCLGGVDQIIYQPST